MQVRARPVLAAALLVLVILGAAVWALTADVYSSTGKRYVDQRTAESQPSFCGSAYDVVLLKHDGFMGGEMPANQNLLDRQCMVRARRDVGYAAVLGVLGLIVGAMTYRRVRAHW